MATFERSHNGSIATLANYKLMGDAVQDALVSFGWEQAADTGQVTDWTALAAFGTSAATANVMVFRNAASALHTIYARLAFWVSAGVCAIQVDVGHATDGTGGISGTKLTNSASTLSLPGSTGVNKVMASGDAERFTLSILENGSTGAIVISLDRSRSAAGAATDEYCWLTLYTAASGGGACYSGVQFANGTLSTVYTGQGAVSTVRMPVNTNVYNGTAAVSPIFPIVGRIGNPSVALMVIGANDAALDSQVEINMYGATHLYRALPADSFGYAWTGSKTYNILALWE